MVAAGRFATEPGVARSARSSANVINRVLRDRPRPPAHNPEFELFLACAGSDEWGLNVIRTIWLGFTFLIVLAAAGSFKFAFGNFGAANASAIGRTEVGRIVVARIVQPTVTNTEPLPNVSPAPAIAELAPVVADLAPAVAELAKFDPIAMEAAPSTPPPPPAKRAAKSQRLEPAMRQTQDRKPDRKVVKSDVIASKPQQTDEPKPCQLEEFDALRWAFNLPTGCHI